jgi:hypothetical protein
MTKIQQIKLFVLVPECFRTCQANRYALVKNKEQQAKKSKRYRVEKDW